MLIQDFDLIRSLGEGASGIVHLVREKGTGLLYALKSVQKHDEQSVEGTNAEQNTLILFRGEDRVMQFYASFQDSENFYIVTVSISLFSLLIKNRYSCGPGVSPGRGFVQPYLYA